MTASTIALFSCDQLLPASDSDKRTFFYQQYDTAWLDDRNYWWVDTVATVINSEGIPVYSITIEFMYASLYGYAYWKDSSLYFSSYVEGAYEPFLVCGRPIFSNQDSAHGLHYYTRHDDLVDISDAYPTTTQSYWFFSRTDGILGFAFYDSSKQSFSHCTGSCCPDVIGMDFHAQAGSPQSP
jgi:hypothetical protein